MEEPRSRGASLQQAYKPDSVEGDHLSVRSTRLSVGRVNGACVTLLSCDDRRSPGVMAGACAAKSPAERVERQNAIKDSPASLALLGMGQLDSDLEDLYRRRHGAFQVMLASVTGSVESARDVVQEAFAQALRDQNGFRSEGSLEGWVWRIALRLAIGAKGSRELAVDELPDVAFVDESRDQALADAVRQLSHAATDGDLPAVLRGSLLRRDRRGARNRRRNRGGDPVQGARAARRRTLGSRGDGMNTYEDTLLAARFDALAPEPPRRRLG